jgi:DNA-binding NtrC family response regulator
MSDSRNGSHPPAGLGHSVGGTLVTPRRPGFGEENVVSESVRRAGSSNSMPVLHLIVVDDDDSVRNACLEIARTMGFAVVGANDVETARGILKHQKIDLMLLDLKAPGGDGRSLLEDIKTLYPETSVVVMTAFATVSNAVEAMRIGAGDYLTKPFALEELVAILERAGELRHFDLETRRLREKLRNQKGAGHMIGHSPEMEKVYRILSKVAHSSHPVLILGESGTGKELVARQIHFNGPNALKPFVPIDCGSLVPGMIEAELFGYVKGTFGEGYAQSREGLLAAAEGGTVYLDEIGELTLDLQAKLLRALQERTVRPLGGSIAVPISARVLAGTSGNLMAMVEQGRFRKDLYFRLNVVNLRIPPLRERKQDLPLLAQHLLDRIQRESGVSHTLSDDALHTLMAYDWPGNVRELEGALVRACALSSGPILHLGDLPTQLQDMRMHRLVLASDDAMHGAPLEGRIVSIADMEREAILTTLRQLKGDKLMAARLLGIGKTTLYRKLKEYGFTEGMEGALDN